MTGAEFLEKIRNIKNIESIDWVSHGGDGIYFDKLDLVVVADHETFLVEIYHATPSDDGMIKEHNLEWMQVVSICLILNKLMELLGLDETFDVGLMEGDGILLWDLSDAIDYSRKCIKERSV